MNDEICRSCLIKCEYSCEAMQELQTLMEEQSKKDKTTKLRSLMKRLEFETSKPSREMKHLANKIIDHYEELRFIKEYCITIGFVMSNENKKGRKVTYADCLKVSEPYKAYLPFDYIITFYDINTSHMSENQKKILMLHELKHIELTPKGLGLRPHDIEDFEDIIYRYGIHWNTIAADVPDILKE